MVPRNLTVAPPSVVLSPMLVVLKVGGAACGGAVARHNEDVRAANLVDRQWLGRVELTRAAALASS